MSELKLKVKCVCCGYTKEVDETQRTTPLCDICGSPMMAVSADLTH